MAEAAQMGISWGSLLVNDDSVFTREAMRVTVEGDGARRVGSQMQIVVKGMVQVAGTTFRIVRIERGHYDVVRIHDDARVGSFWSEPAFAVSGSDDALLREVARSAIQGGKTTWVGRLDLTG